MTSGCFDRASRLPVESRAMSVPSSDELARRDLSVIWHPCTQMHDHQVLPMTPIVRGRGAWLEGHDGRRYLDAISSWWVNLFGHANERINARVREQLERLEHVIFAGFTHEPAIELAERLIRIAPRASTTGAHPASGASLATAGTPDREGLTRCFFADNGSAAVEVAVKMSFHYWRNLGRSGKRRFVTLSNSYHGETLGALAVGNVELYKSIYQPLLMDVITVPSPDCYGRESGESWEAHSRRKFLVLEQTLAERADEIAAVIIEPLVQCAGSMRMYHPVYLELLRAACDRHQVLLIADEIAVGFGRTGTLFACEQAGIRPDLMCLSKGLTGGYLPLSVVLATEPIYRAFYAEYTRLSAFLHSHSYTGNPLACAAALATLDIFATDNMIERNRATARMMGDLAATLGEHPHVAEVRQHGMIVAVELARDKQSREPFDWRERRGLIAYRHALTRGVLLRPIGDVIYFMPPYIVDEREVRLMVDVAREGIALATR